ncbi:MAG: NAD(P)-dependent alcohol dehydrogenase [Dehalococcoidia bacterium]
MRAAVFTEYGPPEVLHLEEVAQPVPGNREVLVRVQAASVNFGDLVVRKFRSTSPRQFHMPFLFWLIGRLTFGVWRPRTTILGSDFAGTVEAAGRDVTRFKPGDQVFGFSGPRMGAYAEFLRIREDAVLSGLPAGLRFDEAASIPYGAVMALALVRKAGLRPGQRVLVVGASGGIGQAIVQLAAGHIGARVTGVCGPANVDFVRSLGAEAAIDYTREDFTTRAETFDIIIDVLGRYPFARCKRVLAPDGRLVYVSFKAKQVLQMVWTSLRGRQKVSCMLMTEKAEHLAIIKGLVEAGTFRAHVGRTFPLEEAAEAHRHAESAQAQGATVILMN